MLCAVISGKTCAFALLEMEEMQGLVDLLEIRLDCMLDWRENLHLIKEKAFCPLIFTLRSHEEGGMYKGSEEEYREALEHALRYVPDYIDIEFRRAKDLALDLKHTTPIYSYHGFGDFPDLSTLYNQMRKKKGIVKIALFCHSALDALKMLSFQKGKKNLCLIPMGEKGAFARILAAIYGSCITYCAPMQGRESAPGQIDVHELLSTYHYRSLDSKTQVYALIGRPIEHSIGHLYHNEEFRKNKSNCLYVKIDIGLSEAESFFTLAKELSFKGLSVTTPLKEEVISLLDQVSIDVKNAHSCNTVVFSKSKAHGFNTDGMGALDLVESATPVKNAEVIILGTGPTARSCGFEAKKRGAVVLYVTRDKTRKQTLSGTVVDYEDLTTHAPQSPIAVVINATSEDLCLKTRFTAAVALDLNYKHTSHLFLSEQSKDTVKLTGKSMFYYQALEQQKIWRRFTLNV